MLYLTRFYAPEPCQGRLTFQINPKLQARIWHNGTAIDPRQATSIALSEGWNTVIVEVEKVSLSVDALLHPHEGFYLRLERPRPGQ